ncbi:MAG: hypothetical protein KGD63_06850 [Candidatus Lokiarchaeota archaeon]|nr:hypothetical protein [Candidatus Lokiarchaeota archaeon]
MNIHSLFILKKTGACIYSRSFTDEIHYDINLMTPFFSAIFSFTENVISRKIEVLEMGGLRFLFKIKDDFIFVILSDSNVSILFVDTRLVRTSEVFFERFPNTNVIVDYQEIEDNEFDLIIDQLITGKDVIFESELLYGKIIKIFRDLVSKNEIIGAAVLSTDGHVIYSILPDEILARSLKELEIRFKVGTVKLPELFYSLENGQKVFSKLVEISWKRDNFIIVMLFENSVPLGMAEITLNKVSKAIIGMI